MCTKEKSLDVAVHLQKGPQFVDIPLEEEDSSDEEYQPDEEEEDETAEEVRESNPSRMFNVEYFVYSSVCVLQTLLESDLESSVSSPRGNRGKRHRSHSEHEDEISSSSRSVKYLQRALWLGAITYNSVLMISIRKDNM